MMQEDMTLLFLRTNTEKKNSEQSTDVFPLSHWARVTVYTDATHQCYLIVIFSF